MRCLNCHTVMMDTDPICPSCRTPVERATAAPPEASSRPNGLWMMLPLFGGALGGALYAGVLMAHESTAPTRSRGAAGFADPGGGGLAAFKLLAGLLLFLMGAIFLAIAAVQFWGVRNIAHREP